MPIMPMSSPKLVFMFSGLPIGFPFSKAILYKPLDPILSEGNRI